MVGTELLDDRIGNTRTRLGGIPVDRCCDIEQYSFGDGADDGSLTTHATGTGKMERELDAFAGFE